jgi:hypothetical protein
MGRVLLTAVLLVAAPSASAWQAGNSPSLGEIAERTKKEREARRAGKPAVKVITEADLKAHSWGTTESEAAPAGATTATTPAAAPGAPDARKEKTDDEIRAEKRQQIEKQIAEQVEIAGIVRKAMDDAQRELNDPSTAYVFGSRGAALQKLLDDGQVELKKSAQAIADLEEQARRQGIAVSRP